MWGKVIAKAKENVSVGKENEALVLVYRNSFRGWSLFVLSRAILHL